MPNKPTKRKEKPTHLYREESDPFASRTTHDKEVFELWKKNAKEFGDKTKFYIGTVVWKEERR